MPLTPIQSDSIIASHGFFTRNGGVSDGIYRELNCGRGSKDQADHVIENRTRIATHFSVETDQLLSVYQCHSADVVTVDGPLAETPKADAMVTATKGVALGILTADCAPILFCDAKNSVIGAAHSGWKGTLGGIGPATVTAMEQLGAERAHIKATIGPTISQKNYEVGEEFFENFLAESPDYTRFFVNGPSGKYQFDLPSFILAALRETGIEADWTGHCTYEDEEKFFSYRRATHRQEPDYGRLISAIML